jgi:serine/threonine protein kinase
MNAAEQLEGLILEDGWKVGRRIERDVHGTGGMFSQSYLVEREGKRGFLKAFDFRDAFEPGEDTLALLRVLTSTYEHERDVLEHCRNRRLSNIVIAVAHGSTSVPGLSRMEGLVYYLVFELAEGDVRCQMNTSTSFDAQQSMRALKDVSLGLWQVHKEMIAHQDTKPSNVLHYGERGFKIADFGRASRRGHPVWHDDAKIAGDRSYAPPELLYGYTHPDFGPRRLGCDLYMLGNLAAFMFSGRNITGLLLEALAPEHHPSRWAGTYEQVLPYLMAAFVTVLEDLSPLVEDLVRPDVLRLISELCTPDLARRGHPRGIGRPEQYSLERYVSLLDVACKRLDVRSRLARQPA